MKRLANPGSRARRRAARGSGAAEDTACRSRPAADTAEHSRRHHHLHRHTGPGLGDVQADGGQIAVKALGALEKSQRAEQPEKDAALTVCERTAVSYKLADG